MHSASEQCTKKIELTTSFSIGILIHFEKSELFDVICQPSMLSFLLQVLQQITLKLVW